MRSPRVLDQRQRSFAFKRTSTDPETQGRRASFLSSAIGAGADKHVVEIRDPDAVIEAGRRRAQGVFTRAARGVVNRAGLDPVGLVPGGRVQETGKKIVVEVVLGVPRRVPDERS